MEDDILPPLPEVYDEKNYIDEFNQVDNTDYVEFEQDLKICGNRLSPSKIPEALLDLVNQQSDENYYKPTIFQLTDEDECVRGSYCGENNAVEDAYEQIYNNEEVFQTIRQKFLETQIEIIGYEDPNDFDDSSDVDVDENLEDIAMSTINNKKLLLNLLNSKNITENLQQFGINCKVLIPRVNILNQNEIRLILTILNSPTSESFQLVQKLQNILSDII